MFSKDGARVSICTAGRMRRPTAGSLWPTVRMGRRHRVPFCLHKSCADVLAGLNKEYRGRISAKDENFSGNADIVNDGAVRRAQDTDIEWLGLSGRAGQVHQRNTQLLPVENQNRETVVDMSAIVESVTRDQTLSGNADGVVISTGCLPKVVGEPAQLKHLISNLVRNAILHGRKSDRILRIEVGSRLQGSEDVIFVSDDGKGIAPEHRDRIFEYFYRGDSQSGGSGIGLSFCQQVVERAGHRIWVEDSPGDQGATFCFTVTVAGDGDASSDS